MKLYSAIIHKIGAKAAAISGIVLLGMMLLIVANVVLRPMGAVFAGTYELIEALIVIVVAGAIGYTELGNNHVRVDLFVSRFPRRLQGLAESLIYILGIGLWGVILWSSINIMKVRWLNENTTILDVPLLPFRFIWIIGLIFLILILLLRFLQGLIKVVKK